MKLRTLFDKMPPHSHSTNLDESEALQYIQEVLQANGLPHTREDTLKAFNSMRNIRSMVLVYDVSLHKWKGCLYVPTDTVLGMGEVSIRLNRLEKKMKRLEKYLRNAIDTICDNSKLSETN